MHTDDGHIVHQCLSGNTGAFALLVDKYKARLFALVYAKVGQFEDAEDITQDVFLNAYRKLSTLRRWDNFYAWLYSIASNRCKEFHRAEKRRLDAAFLADQSENYQADMDAHTEKLKNEQIHDALDSLPEIHRQVLVLRYMAGMRSKEIAQTLRVSPNTVNQRLMRARTQLKAVLNEEMITMIPTAFAERKLQPGFTAQIIELIKGTQIQTAPHKTALPLGLSAAGGVILLLLSLSIPQSPLYPVGEWLGGPLPLNTRVVDDGEIAVDAEAAQVAILGGEQGIGTFGQNPERRELPTVIGQPEDSPEPEKTLTRLHMLDDFSPGWNLDFSPDGTRIVYYSLGRPDVTIPPGLVVRSLVSDSPNGGAEPVVLLDEDRATYYQPKWSPDGKWIAFLRQELPMRDGASYSDMDEYIDSFSNMDVYLIPASGGEKRFLAATDSQDQDILSWSPDSKELAFVKRKGKNADIFIVSRVTGKERPFTTDGRENIKPTWSSDGRYITYLSQRGSWFSGHQRWIQALAGGKPRILKGSDRDPVLYSPDGEWLAYLRRTPDQPYGFYISQIDSQGDLSGEPILLKAAISDRYGKPIKWTTNGRIITLEEDYGEKTYALSTEDGEMRLMSSDLERLAPNERVQWLSGGTRLFLLSRTDLSPNFFDIEKGLVTPLPIPLPEGMRFSESAISPDEQRIAFVQYGIKKTTDESSPEFPVVNVQLKIAETKGGTSKLLTQTGAPFVNPRWSPDGQEIAFINAKIGEQGIGESKLCVVSVITGEVRTLTDSELYMNLAWSPDGTMLAYLGMKNQGKGFDPDELEGDLYVIPAAGGAPKRITNTPENEMKTAWTPDGKHITFEIHGEMWIASVDGKNPRQITFEPHGEMFKASVGEAGPRKLKRGYIPSSWSSDGQSYLAFGDLGELLRVYLDGTTSLELPIPVPADARPLSMSPDGETILYQRIDSGTQCWMVDASQFASQ